MINHLRTLTTHFIVRHLSRPHSLPVAAWVWLAWRLMVITGGVVAIFALLRLAVLLWA
jgi:hypothetical protein